MTIVTNSNHSCVVCCDYHVSTWHGVDFSKPSMCIYLTWTVVKKHQFSQGPTDRICCDKTKAGPSSRHVTQKLSCFGNLAQRNSIANALPGMRHNIFTAFTCFFLFFLVDLQGFFNLSSTHEILDMFGAHENMAESCATQTVEKYASGSKFKIHGAALRCFTSNFF